MLIFICSSLVFCLQKHAKDYYFLLLHLQAYVVLSQSGDFDNLIIDGLTTRTESKDVTRSVNVSPLFSI